MRVRFGLMFQQINLTTILLQERKGGKL